MTMSLTPYPARFRTGRNARSMSRCVHVSVACALIAVALPAGGGRKDRRYAACQERRRSDADGGLHRANSSTASRVYRLPSINVVAHRDAEFARRNAPIARATVPVRANTCAPVGASGAVSADDRCACQPSRQAVSAYAFCIRQFPSRSARSQRPMPRRPRSRSAVRIPRSHRVLHGAYEPGTGDVAHRSSFRGGYARGARRLRPAMAQNCGWSRIDHRVSYDASGVVEPECLSRARRRADDRRNRRRRLGRLGIALRQDAVAGHRFGDHRRRCGDGRQVHLHARAPRRQRQPVPVVQGWLELQLSERRSIGRRGAGHALRARVRPRQPGHVRAAAACRSTSARAGSRIRRTGRPTCWRAGRSAGFPAGTRTAATSRS